MPSPELLTLVQAGAELGISPSRLRRMSIDKLFPADKYGDLWLVSRRNLEAFRALERPRGRPPKTTTPTTPT
jgi:hypothetical protein